MTIFNVYCDESGHLPNDGLRVMVLGAISCPLERVRVLSDELRALKSKHGLSPRMEVKWTKISPAKVDFYLDLVEFFFQHEEVCFRALIIPDKSILNHAEFDQDHDTWYFKMYFTMLKAIIETDNSFRIYLDIKDTRSADKVKKLHDVLCNSNMEYNAWKDAQKG